MEGNSVKNRSVPYCLYQPVRSSTTFALHESIGKRFDPIEGQRCSWRQLGFRGQVNQSATTIELVQWDLVECRSLGEEVDRGVQMSPMVAPVADFAQEVPIRLDRPSRSDPNGWIWWKSELSIFNRMGKIDDTVQRTIPVVIGQAQLGRK